MMTPSIIRILSATVLTALVLTTTGCPFQDSSIGTTAVTGPKSELMKLTSTRGAAYAAVKQARQNVAVSTADKAKVDAYLRKVETHYGKAQVSANAICDYYIDAVHGRVDPEQDKERIKKYTETVNSEVEALDRLASSDVEGQTAGQAMSVASIGAAIVGGLELWEQLKKLHAEASKVAEAQRAKMVADIEARKWKNFADI